MPQSNGRHTLKRIEFEFDGKSYSFALNPEEYSQTEPNKATVTQTMGGAFVDQFGAGLVEITLRGTTGFKNGTNDPNNGFEKFKELRDLIRASYQNTDASKEVKFYNYTDEEYWNVFVERFSLSRSRSRALLYQYDIKLTALRKLSDTTEGSTSSIGNLFAIRDTSISAEDGGYTGTLNDILMDETNNVNINSDLDEKAHETLATVIRNLSVVVGGYDGLFSSAIAKYITSNMTVLETGDIPNIPLDNITENESQIMQSEIERWVSGIDLQFDTKVSRSTAQLFKVLSEPNSPLIATSQRTQQNEDSILIDALKADRLQIVPVKQIRIILLEAMNLYHCLNRIINGASRELDLSEKDIDRIINNITYVSKRLEKLQPLPISTLTELRNLQQNICHIRAIPELFYFQKRGIVG